MWSWAQSLSRLLKALLTYVFISQVIYCIWTLRKVVTVIFLNYTIAFPFKTTGVKCHYFKLKPNYKSSHNWGLMIKTSRPPPTRPSSSNINFVTNSGCRYTQLPGLLFPFLPSWLPADINTIWMFSSKLVAERGALMEGVEWLMLSKVSAVPTTATRLHGVSQACLCPLCLILHWGNSVKNNTVCYDFTLTKLFCLLTEKPIEYFSSNFCDINMTEITFYTKLYSEFQFYFYLCWSVEIIKTLENNERTQNKVLSLCSILKMWYPSLDPQPNEL